MAYTEDFFEVRDLTLSDGILIVDIDKTKTSFVNKMSDIPEFPKGYRKSLEKKIDDLKNTIFKQNASEKLADSPKGDELEDVINHIIGG